MVDDFRNPIGINEPRSDTGTFRAPTLADAFGHGFIQCFEQLNDEDLHPSKPIDRDDVHALREQLYLVMVAAFRSAHLDQVHPPGRDNEYLDEVLDYSEGIGGGVVVEEAGEMRVGGDPDGDPDFIVRWRLLRVDDDGYFLFGLQLNEGPGWKTMHGFLVSPNVMPLFYGGPAGVDSACKQFIVTARRARLFSILDNIAKWCDSHEMLEEASIVDSVALTVSMGHSQPLAQLVEAFVKMNDDVARAVRERRN